MLLDGSPDVVGDVLKRKKNAPQAIWARGAFFFCRSQGDSDCPAALRNRRAS